MAYQITFKASALKQTEKLDKSIARKIITKISSLSNTPRPSGCTKLAGFASLWRIRVGDYRVVYAIDDKVSTIDIRIIAHRREVYRDL